MNDLFILTIIRSVIHYAVQIRERKAGRRVGNVHDNPLLCEWNSTEQPRVPCIYLGGIRDRKASPIAAFIVISSSSS